MLSIDCVIPAAGMSTRLSSHKLLADFAGRPLIHWSVQNALAACSRVILVLGHNEKKVRSILSGVSDLPGVPDDSNLKVVSNPDYHRGMLSSIARGAREVRSARFFVAPADMPFLLPGLYQSIAQAASDPADKLAAWFPLCKSRPAHPVLVASWVVPQLLTILDSDTVAGQSGNRGPLPPLESMRKFLSRFPCVEVPTTDKRSTIDIDTPDALTRYSGMAGELT